MLHFRSSNRTFSSYAAVLCRWGSASSLWPPFLALANHLRAGIHCFLREEVCGDLFILAKGAYTFSHILSRFCNRVPVCALSRFYRRCCHPGRCIVECSHNHLFVEAPAVMGASFIWYVSPFPQYLFVTSCAGTSATHVPGST
jgi:hypothetical protein